MPVSSPERAELLTTTEAAALAGVSAETMRRAVRLGEIAIARKIGNSYLLAPAAVEAWAAQRRGERGEEGHS